MLNVFFLLSISGGLFESFDYEGGCGGDDGDSGLTVLDGELDSYTETFLSFCEQSGLRHWRSFVHTQSPVALAISSPTFFGDRPRGPILGARAEEAPTSPPVALKVLRSYVSARSCLSEIGGVKIQGSTHISFTSLGSNFGAVARSVSESYTLRVTATYAFLRRLCSNGRRWSKV